MVKMSTRKATELIFSLSGAPSEARFSPSTYFDRCVDSNSIVQRRPEGLCTPGKLALVNLRTGYIIPDYYRITRLPISLANDG